MYRYSQVNLSSNVRKSDLTRTWANNTSEKKISAVKEAKPVICLVNTMPFYTRKCRINYLAHWALNYERHLIRALRWRNYVKVWLPCS